MDPAELVRLGRTGLSVSRLALGTVWLGNMYDPVEEAAAADVVDQALDMGVRLIDTAPLYGLGLAEQRIGRVLAQRPRDSFVLSTKVGRTLRPCGPGEAAPFLDGRPQWVGGAPAAHPEFDFSYDATMRNVASSLERLGLDRIDILLIHDPDDHFTQAVDGAYRALHELREQGAVGAIGAGMNQAPMLAEFVRSTDIDCLLLAGRYTLLDHSGLDELLPECHRRGVGVLAGGVFNSGVLADPSPGALFDYHRVQAPVLARAQAIRAVCDRFGVALPAVALRFPFGHPAVTSVVAGVRSVAELRADADHLRCEIPPDLWQALRVEGLLPEHVPVP